MEDESTNYSRRKVGHIVIHWRIHNYILTRPSCCIISPEFLVRGPQTTKWKLTLHPYSCSNEKDAVLQLQRLDKEPVVVYGVWRVSMKDYRGNYFCLTGNQAFFRQYSVYETIISDAVRRIHEHFRPLDFDVLYLQCQLLVSCKEANKSFKRCSDIGLNSLSRDLLALYKCGEHSDIEIRMNDHSISAHKAILHARSRYFRNFIEKHTNENEHDLRLLNIKAVNKVLSYLYSGKLEFVLGKPSISIYDCAQLFEIKEIKQYYSLDDLFFESKIDTEDISYTWRIQNFNLSSNLFVQSPCFSDLVSNVTVLASLYPKGEDGNSNFFSLIVEIRQITSQQRICLEIGLMDHECKFWCHSRKVLTDRSSHRIKFEQFANRDILHNREIYVGVLNVGIRLRVIHSEATWKTSVTSRQNALISPNEMEHPYCHLSKDIGSLFTSDVCKDMTLVTGCINLQVHKCVLAARSHGFKKLISQETSCNVDMKPEILVNIMKYLYSGILKDKPGDVTEMYTIAEDFSMPNLKSICNQILENDLTVQNASDVLIFSGKKEDKNLKRSVLKFISLNQSAVYEQQNWQKLCESHPLLYNDALEFYNLFAIAEDFMEKLNC